MKRSTLQSLYRKEAGSLLAAVVLTATAAVASEPERNDLVLTSTNDPAANAVVVFHLGAGTTPELSYVATVPTGGKGGAGNNAGILRFDRDSGGAVANFGSNSVTVLGRDGDTIRVRHTMPLASGCLKPDSVALSHDRLFVVGANCAESHAWPSGALSGTPVHLTDPSAAQIAVGRNLVGRDHDFGFGAAAAAAGGRLPERRCDSSGAAGGCKQHPTRRGLLGKRAGIHPRA